VGFFDELRTNKFKMWWIEQDAEKEKEQRNHEYVMKKWKLSNLNNEG